MSAIQMDELMMKRLERAGTFSGRTHLQMALYLRQMLWSWGLTSAALTKRLLDVVGSAFLIVALTPVMLLVALCIKIEDRGPLVFAQTRVGKFGRLFKMYKFRSMCVNAEARMAAVLAQNQHKEGITFKMKDDPRITKVGKWLRKLSLDELPQLFNVFNGQMSLVGPRPPVPREVALYSQEDRRRLNVTPGITCFWQVGGRANIPFPQQVELDVMYIERQGFWLDVALLLKTVPAVVFHKGAY
jgi:lipopolysaccharide/colanic/teichoic acid biosynthesis glycosyltransferase